jgi:hypothetical protein
MLQQLIYSNFVFLSSDFSKFYVFIFRIIFGQTCYSTTVSWELDQLSDELIYDVLNYPIKNQLHGIPRAGIYVKLDRGPIQIYNMLEMYDEIFL